jgi:kynureninase
MSTIPDAAPAHRLDADDPLAPFRARFVVADPRLIYLDGNSLGRLPQAAAALAERALQQQWGERLIRSWNEGWMELPGRVGAKIARLIGAQADEVIVADSTSVNLFKLAAAALAARPGRRRILSDDLQFPSDLYILQGLVELVGQGHRLEIAPSPDGIHGPVETLRRRLDSDVALLVLSLTAFKSAYTYDLAALTAAAHQVGALILWDLSHAAGAVPVDLNAAGADLAVGCTYKYLNGGPGAPAFLFIRRDLQERLTNPISGWMGRARPFEFALDYHPAPGLTRFLSGTPAILSLAPVEAGVDLLLEAGMAAVREKSIRQTDYLIHLWETMLAPLGYTLNSPRQAERRGSHLALGHADGWRIAQALIHDLGVLPDFRAPDNIRLGVTPLYTTYSELYTAALALHDAVSKRHFEHFSAAAGPVT